MQGIIYILDVEEWWYDTLEGAGAFGQNMGVCPGSELPSCVTVGEVP